MKIDVLQTNPKTYSSNVYLIRGSFNSLVSVNTLIDTGGDCSILEQISKFNTGIGKKAIDQIIITHNHFDHTGGIKALKEAYNCKVFAYSAVKMVDVLIADRDVVKIGDSHFIVLHTPGHSHDSICLYYAEQGILFVGDTQIDIKTPGGCYTSEYVQTLEKLAVLSLKIIYPGHGAPLDYKPSETIRRTLDMVRKSMVH